jgi:hypothetical protein
MLQRVKYFLISYLLLDILLLKFTDKSVMLNK